MFISTEQTIMDISPPQRSPHPWLIVISDKRKRATPRGEELIQRCLRDPGYYKIAFKKALFHERRRSGIEQWREAQRTPPHSPRLEARKRASRRGLVVGNNGSVRFGAAPLVGLEPFTVTPSLFLLMQQSCCRNNLLSCQCNINKTPEITVFEHLDCFIQTSKRLKQLLHSITTINRTLSHTRLNVFNLWACTAIQGLVPNWLFTLP